MHDNCARQQFRSSQQFSWSTKTSSAECQSSQSVLCTPFIKPFLTGQIPTTIGFYIAVIDLIKLSQTVIIWPVKNDLWRSRPIAIMTKTNNFRHEITLVWIQVFNNNNTSFIKQHHTQEWVLHPHDSTNIILPNFLSFYLCNHTLFNCGNICKQIFKLSTCVNQMHIQ